MEFNDNLVDLYMENTTSVGLQIPSSRDVYFLSKQKELISQYSQARFFLAETNKESIAHFTDNNDETLVYMGCFYETALLYYNIVVDLSWVLCYTAIEYSVNNGDQPANYGDIDSIKEAFDKLRVAENLVQSPTEPTSPIYYLRKMYPAYSDVIDHITDFWKTYVKSDIRHDYNFIKHKGKPRYTKQTKGVNGRILLLKYNSNISATDSRDIMKEVSLASAIPTLKKFDEEQLYPYIKTLIKKLFVIVNPSALAQ